MDIRRKIFAAAAAAGFALSGCSPAANQTQPDSPEDAGSAKTAITFRLWDETAKASYERSFKEFTKQNPDIDVKLELVPWDNYWKQIPLDISAGQMADVYLVNSANFAQYADAGNLLDISKTVGSKHEQWQKSVVDLYTRNGVLWGVPQLWDSIALFYNKDLLEKADVDPTKLTWAPFTADGSPASEDTFLPAAKKLTVDTGGKTAAETGFDAANIKTFAFNAQADMQAIYLDFWAQNGAVYQQNDGTFDFGSDKGAEAAKYLIDLIHKHHIAPPAAETNINPDISRDLFIRGEMAMFQSGPYNLKHIAANAKFDWGIAPMVSGPEGRVSVVHGVAAVGNAQTKHKEAAAKLLTWLGSKAGQLPLAADGVSFPGVVEAQEAFVNYWAKQGVDVSIFVKAASQQTTPAPFGAEVAAGINAYTPLLLDLFLGAKPVPAGLKEAQDAGNKAMGK